MDDLLNVDEDLLMDELDDRIGEENQSYENELGQDEEDEEADRL